MFVILPAKVNIHMYTKWTIRVSIVTAVHNDIDASVLEGTNNSDLYFIAISIILIIWIIKKFALIVGTNPIKLSFVCKLDWKLICSLKAF